ncbi:zinc finger MYM-type protein 1-like [Camellia sinensis]|uniref:zinc finger MYM-type protein 1-like n=1 Tax=Camellia sinensis TaxID=4442 RepID=UPI00103601CA|nr:zinc finger MYM-type protein 1-like [Camellia sinensis]
MRMWQQWFWKMLLKMLPIIPVGFKSRFLVFSLIRYKKFVHEEINDGNFCILVDESEDESKREQMAIVLRFLDKYGFIKERFFDIVHVLDTTPATLKEEICIVLSRHNLSVQNIRGQGYDGASNMSGEWTGLQALFCAECPFAYYVHCFAHRLQLALVRASKLVISINQFFSYLTRAINMVGLSCKRHDQLRAAQATDIAKKLAIDDEFETGKGKNQIGTLKRVGDTRWGSHLGSICSLINMFSATCAVLRNIINDGSKSNLRAEADGVYDSITSFEFVFILHLMRDIMEITNDLCQALQSKSQDILNAMHLVFTTKILIQKFREDGWVPLLEKIKLFSNDHGIQIPDMSCPYKGGRGRSRSERDQLTMEHHFRVDIFMITVDSQLQELNNKFKEDVMELFVLSSALDPRDGYRSFNIEDICKLANKFYPMDFSEQEKLHLKYQLENYKLDISILPEFQKLSTISELCQMLAKTKKSTSYPLIDRLIRLVLTLPVSTATSERAILAMKLVKSKLRNRMEDGFLTSYLITYIEQDIARGFDVDSIIDAFDIMKEH